MTYNGYTNYETWLVCLWIDNDQGTYEIVRDLVKENGPEGIRDGMTAANLHDLIDEMMPDLGANLASDLLNAALSEVNWQEVAEAHYDEAVPLVKGVSPIMVGS